jgi:hypothetical protein
MARVRLNLAKLSVTEKIARGRHYVTKLTNNPAFADPHPSLAEVNAAVDELEAASAQVQSVKSEITTRVATQEVAVKKLDGLLTRLGSYVESVAGNDNTLISSAGMEIKGSRSPATIPTTPQGLSATTGDHDGEIILSWKPVPNAYSYIIEFSLDPATPNTWSQLGIATSASKAIGNLTSGKRHWFRTKAVGAAGESGWSEHASKVVP